MSLAAALRVFIVVCLLAMGAIAGWAAKVWTLEVEPVVEKARPEVRKPDGSVVAAVKPESRPAIAAPAITPGSRIERTIEVTVQQKPEAQGEGSCKPLDLRVDILRNPDGTVDAQVFAPNGEVLTATHFPVAQTFIAKQRPWLVAGAYNLDDGSVSVVAGRDVLRRVFVGGMLTDVNDAGAIGAHLVLGARF